MKVGVTFYKSKQRGHIGSWGPTHSWIIDYRMLTDVQVLYMHMYAFWGGVSLLTSCLNLQNKTKQKNGEKIAKI